MEQVKIGIIGGSGLYQMPELTDITEVEVETPFGKPSDAFIIGTLEGERVAFLPRHGRGHKLTPTELPFRANIYAMKLLGVDYILSVSAVGSLREDYAPTDFCIPDQFFDRTHGRISTFFGEAYSVDLPAEGRWVLLPLASKSSCRSTSSFSRPG